jgi:hypothetical protein
MSFGADGSSSYTLRHKHKRAMKKKKKQYNGVRWGLRRQRV